MSIDVTPGDLCRTLLPISDKFEGRRVFCPEGTIVEIVRVEPGFGNDLKVKCPEGILRVGGPLAHHRLRPLRPLELLALQADENLTEESADD